MSSHSIHTQSHSALHDAPRASASVGLFDQAMVTAVVIAIAYIASMTRESIPNWVFFVNTAVVHCNKKPGHLSWVGPGFSQLGADPRPEVLAGGPWARLGLKLEA